MNRRRMMMQSAGGGGRLPVGYERAICVYPESATYSRGEIDYIPNENTIIEIGVSNCTLKENYLFGNDQYFLALRNIAYGDSSATIYYKFGANSTWPPTATDFTNFYGYNEFRAGNELSYKNGEDWVSIKSVSTYPTSQNKIDIFGYNGINKGKYYLYYFKIFEGNALIKNYIPCQAEGVGGVLYDTISCNTIRQFNKNGHDWIAIV